MAVEQRQRPPDEIVEVHGARGTQLLLVAREHLRGEVLPGADRLLRETIGIEAAILGVADARLELLVLTGVIVIAMSLFLSIAAAVVNFSAKSFHYAPGLGERTEAFLCLSLMTLDAARLQSWTWVFTGVIIVTIVQRIVHVRKLLSGSEQADVS